MRMTFWTYWDLSVCLFDYWDVLKYFGTFCDLSACESIFHLSSVCLSIYLFENIPHRDGQTHTLSKYPKLQSDLMLKLLKSSQNIHELFCSSSSQLYEHYAYFLLKPFLLNTDDSFFIPSQPDPKPLSHAQLFFNHCGSTGFHDPNLK